MRCYGGHMERREAIREALSSALGTEVGELHLCPVGGGCINEAALLEAAGETFFVKWNTHPLPGQFAAEAAGLSALAEAGTSLVIPRPIAWSDESPARAFLVLEYLPPGRRIPRFDEALGHGLAELHRTTSEHGFGFFVDGYCGATPQPNGWMERWVDFYAERRLRHQIRLARSKGMSTTEVQELERVVERVPELLDDGEPPALIHGDLWSGNLHVALDGRPALVDPAAYFAHREAELGMMLLFGGFSQRVLDAYAEAYPLREGWRDRVELYSLYHVLNHFNLFGGSYGAQALRIARRYA